MGGDTRFESSLGDVKHSKAYYERKAREAEEKMKRSLAYRDREYRRMLGVTEDTPLPKRLGQTEATSSKGRRRKFERKGKAKARNTTMKRAIRNVK